VSSDKGDQDEAIKVYTETIRLDPTCAPAHYGLGLARQRKNDLNGAAAAYRDAIRNDVAYVPAHVNMGRLLMDEGNLDGAVVEFLAAIRIDRDHAIAHYNLGLALRKKGDLNGAIAEYKEAIRIRPKYADAHTNLGWVLQLRGDLEGAVTKYKDALRVDPNHSIARDNLTEAERMRELLLKLPGILSGTAKPATPAEACEYAELCNQPFQKRYAAAARLFEVAFTADPKLADDMARSYRYSAACAAAKSARGDGVDVPVDLAVRAALRSMALGWLRADLALHQKKAASPIGSERKSAAMMLSWWLKDSDLSGVRPGLLRIGMAADDLAAWDSLWAEVKATLAEAQKPAPPPEVAPSPRQRD
jgi:tetratricopeptide (TPR) repeat protein